MAGLFIETPASGGADGGSKLDADFNSQGGPKFDADYQPSAKRQNSSASRLRRSATGTVPASSARAGTRSTATVSTSRANWNGSFVASRSRKESHRTMRSL